MGKFDIYKCKNCKFFGKPECPYLVESINTVFTLFNKDGYVLSKETLPPILLWTQYRRSRIAYAKRLIKHLDELPDVTIDQEGRYDYSVMTSEKHERISFNPSSEGL